MEFIRLGAAAPRKPMITRDTHTRGMMPLTLHSMSDDVQHAGQHAGLLDAQLEHDAAEDHGADDADHGDGAHDAGGQWPDPCPPPYCGTPAGS